MHRKRIKKVKIKTNELFTLAFNNIIKFNSDVLSGFKPIIFEIFDYMTNNINNTIKDSFGNFKKKMIENLDEICCLGKENISTFNIDIVNKLNSLNKHIN